MRIYILIGVVWIGITHVQAQKVQIINADELRYDASTQSKYCKGNIKVLHEGVFIECDSAIINDKYNTIDGVGQVRIYQPDTFNMSGKRVFYDGKTKMARVSGDVILTDRKMILTTPYIDYDTRIKSGSYGAGGKIINENDVLTSDKGYYNSRNSTASFKGNVVLVNPDYTMKGDTLQYITTARTAYFYGPTVINSEQNRIECTWGYYNTASNLASFSKRATIFGESSDITADSFFYNRNTGDGQAFGNIVLNDTSEGVKVYGQKGLYMEKRKETVINGLPMSERLLNEDTMLLMADTFYYFSDTAIKKLIAFKNAQIFSPDIAGICDTLIYFMKDSVILMLHKPILWNENNQITGDSISVYMKDDKLDYMFVRNEGFVASWLEEDRFNQMAGNEIYNYFDDGKLRRVNLIGQGQSVYYVRDDESDTSPYSGVNKIVSGQITIYMDSTGINNIRFYPNPEPSGTLYPPADIPEKEKTLEGLNWQIQLKPQEQEFYKRKKINLKV
ncbi:MAG: hypothetical protein LC109_00710 [Bacteroidia bacterium]|nr:hypothetical protein [Bacteroidia bacterium]MCO5253160.1 hypothetical protein [Bacteroidota bacterium]MCZ2128771.1 hypothetical protein [Bacteroidia bacterium]